MTMRMMNRFVQLETSPVSGGADIRLVARGEYFFASEIDHDTGEVIVRVRRDAGPQVGETLMIGKRLVTVGKRRFDPHGRLQVMDADTGAWYAVPDREDVI
jgi:hypothetical protein